MKRKIFKIIQKYNLHSSVRNFFFFLTTHWGNYRESVSFSKVTAQYIIYTHYQTKIYIFFQHLCACVACGTIRIDVYIHCINVYMILKYKMCRRDVSVTTYLSVKIYEEWLFTCQLPSTFLFYPACITVHRVSGQFQILEVHKFKKISTVFPVTFFIISPHPNRFTTASTTRI